MSRYVDDPDDAYDRHRAAVDVGEECPRCYAQPEHIATAPAFGMPVHICRLCRCAWLGWAKILDNGDQVSV